MEKLSTSNKNGSVKTTSLPSIKDQIRVGPPAVKTGGNNFFLLLLCGFNSLLLIILFLTNSGRKEENYAFIQTVNGQVVSGAAIDNLQRSDDTLIRFVEGWLKLTHDWSGKLPDGQPDKGSSINGKPAPSALVLGSKALEANFSRAYLNQLQAKYSQQYALSNYVSNQGYEVVLKIVHIGIPKKVGHGIWDIGVVATRMHYVRGEHVSNESFNQRIRVAAIRPSVIPLGDKSSPLVLQHQAMQSSGLSITQITALSANK